MKTKYKILINIKLTVEMFSINLKNEISRVAFEAWRHW